MLQYRNCAPAEQAALTQLLHQLDESFPIPLSHKTDLSSYSAKLLNLGIAYGAWEEEQLVGLCGFYANDMQTKKAYVAVLGVAPEQQRKGIARGLLTGALEQCRRAGMELCCLHTHRTNTGAIALYKSMDFTGSVNPERPEDILFTKVLL